MTDAEVGVLNTILDGLSANDPIPPEEVLGLAIGLGVSTGVSEDRVKEIFEAVKRGVQPGVPPL